MNNIINIIDRNFNFLGQIDNYESLIMTKKWHSIGGFELHLHEDNVYADKLQKENIIFTTERKAYVILHREINLVDGKLIVKGLELKSYLARWLVFPPEKQAYFRVNSNAETIMKEYVQATLDRKSITSIVVAPNQNRGIKTVYQSRYKNLADELEKLSLASGLGWDITLDIRNKRFVFDVYEGQDRTAGQNTLPPAIFSIEYDNIAEQTLIDSKLNFANTAIVAGQGEGAERKIAIVGDAEGLDSFEVFIDARDIENAEDLPERGLQKLSEVQEIFNFDSRVLTNKNLRYEEDFNLGDIITIQNKKWNITTDRRITEVTEIYESDGFKLDIVFGENIPTIKDIIKQTTDTPIAETSKGEPGEPGQDGVGLQFIWDGTSLGVKREDEAEYQFVNLQGPKGEQGEQGPPGKSLEFHWNGTQLGVRVEGQTQYQYVDLKGSQGERGPRGFSLEYDWQGTQLGIKREDESNYQYVDLRGPKGDKGDPGSDANVTYENVTNALGYTPVNKAGDTIEGNLGVNGRLIIQGGMIFQAYGQNIDFNAATLNNITSLSTRGATPSFIMEIDYNGYPRLYNHGFVVLVRNKEGGYPQNNQTFQVIDNQDPANRKLLFGVKPTGLVQALDFQNLEGAKVSYEGHKHQVSDIEGLENVGGGGTKIVTSPTEPTGLTTGDQWHKEY